MGSWIIYFCSFCCLTSRQCQIEGTQSEANVKGCHSWGTLQKARGSSSAKNSEQICWIKRLYFSFQFTVNEQARRLWDGTWREDRFLGFILSAAVQPSGQDRRSGVTVCKPLTRITFPLHAHDATVIYGGEGDGGGGTSYIFKETIGDQKMYLKPKHDLIQVIYVP